MNKNVAAGLALLDQKEEPQIEKKPRPHPGARTYEPDILNKVGSSGFLRSYVQNCIDSTDAPPVFHLGVGLVILGAAMGNRVHIPSYGHQIVYPNIWLVLIAPSGFMRKSTALNLGKSLLVQAVPKRMLPDDFTPEKLADILKDEAAGIMTISEFTKILQILDRDYNRGAKEMLTELYDSPAHYVIQRKMGGKTTITDAAISLLGATTLDWLQERVKKRDLEGGFLARFLFLPATQRGPRITEIPDIAHSIRLSLTDHLKSVAEMEGVADFSLVNKIYNDWLYKYERHVESGGMPSELTGVYSRTGVTARKLAVIFQASLKPGELKISPDAMQSAMAFIEYIHQATAQVARGFGDSWFEKQLIKARQFIISREGRVTREELMLHMKIKARDLDEIMRTLRESGEVEFSTEKTSGRPVTIYTLKH